MSAAPARAGRRRRGRATVTLAGAPWLVGRRLRFEPVPALAMIALVGGICFLFAALPRLFNAFADDGLRYTAAHAPITARNVSELEPLRIAAGDGSRPLSSVARRAASSQRTLPAEVRELIARRTFVVRSPQYVAGGGVPGLVRYLTLRAQSGVRPHIRFVKGRLPQPSSERVDVSFGTGAIPAVIGQPRPATPGVQLRKEVPVVQVALSTSTARELQVDVGDRIVFAPDSFAIPLTSVAIHDEQPLAVDVTGLFAVKDPHSAFWFGDTTLDTPDFQLSPSGDTKMVFGQALVSPDQYPTMLAATAPLPLAYEYRYFVDAQRFDAGRLQRLRDAVARVDARYAGAGPLDPHVQIGLGPILDRFAAARSQAETLLAVAAIGLLACALANLGLLGALAYDRRRSETALSRARGASPLETLLAQAAEGVLLAAPAGLAGWAVAVLAVRGRSSDFSAWLTAGIVVAVVALLVAAIAGVARRPLGPLGRDDVVLARPSPRRLAVEGLVAAAAGLGVYLLRRRGLESTTSGFDPYLAAVPVLLGLACGIVALRLYPVPIAAAARLARRTRGLALHLGLSRAARQPDVASAPLLVVVLALAIASFSAVMLHTLEASQQRTGWRAVGADLRVDAAEDESLPPRLLSRLGAIGRVAPAYVQEGGVVVADETTLLVALDPAAYERVIAGTPAAADVPRALGRPSPIPSIVPAVTSNDWPATGSFQSQFAGKAVNFLTVAQRASFPGIPKGTPFAIVSLRALQNAAGPLEPNRVYVGRGSAAAVREAVRETAPGAEIASRAAVVRSLRASSLVNGVLRGFRAAIVLAALLAAVAVVLTALIASRTRSRDLALVRTMGGSQREALGLAAVELVPFVGAALALGIGLGLAIPYLIEPGLDLAFFTASRTNPLATPWLPPVAFAAGLLVLVGGAVLLAGVRARRANLDRVLRIGER